MSNTIFNNLLDIINHADNNSLNSNQITKADNVNYLFSMAMGRFVWNDLPDELKGKEWYIEKSLILNGCMALYKDKTTDKLVFLRAFPVGALTLYGDHNEYQVIGDNGFTDIIKADDCVICWDNVSRTNFTFSDITQTAERATDIMRTCDVRMKNHKAPVILSGNRKLLSSLKTFWKKLNANESSIIIDEDIGENNLKNIISNDPIFINRDLMYYCNDLLSGFFGRIGINFNPSNHKKEQLNESEVNSNDEQVVNARNIYLEQRKLFCEMANKKFGLNITVEYNTQLQLVDMTRQMAKAENVREE